MRKREDGELTAQALHLNKDPDKTGTQGPGGAQGPGSSWDSDRLQGEIKFTGSLFPSGGLRDLKGPPTRVVFTYMFLHM